MDFEQLRKTPVHELIARKHALEAKRLREDGFRHLAKEKDKEADLWRGLLGLSDKQAAPHCAKWIESARTALDGLGARGGSKQGCWGLVGIAAKALDLLVKHAEAGSELAGASLLKVLAGAVEDFEKVANAKPELFQGTARRRFGIPAIVSRNTEKKKAALDLAGALGESEAYQFAVLPKGTKGRTWSFKERQNALAANLVGQIESVRCELLNFPGDFVPEDWHPDLLALERFPAPKWEAWFEVAWKFLEEGKNPGLSKKENRIVTPQEEGKWTYRDIDETRKKLRASFEQMATGEHPKTKRRKARRGTKG